MSSGRGLCRFCFLCLLSIGFILLFLYLTYRPIRPRYYLTAFSLLSNSSSSAARGAAVASFDLAITNRNRELGVYHDDLILSLLFPSDNSSNYSSSPSATATVPGFYQGRQKTASRSGTFASSPGGARWASINRSAVLRVDLESAVRYKAVVWRSRRHRISLGAEVEVDREGKKTAEDRIRLRSGAPSRQCSCLVPCRCCILAVVFVATTVMRR